MGQLHVDPKWRVAELYIEHMIVNYERKAARQAESMEQVIECRGRISALRTLINEVKSIYENSRNKTERLNPDDFDSTPDGEAVKL